MKNKSVVSILSVLAGACVAAPALANIATDFEWRGGARSLLFSLDPGLENVNVTDALNQQRRPRANAANYTMGDAFRLAMQTWNFANSNAGDPGAPSSNPWRLYTVGALGGGAAEAALPRVTVKLGNTALGADDQGPPNGVPRFRRPQTSGSFGGRTRNDDDNQRQGGAGGVTDALMLFVLKDKLTPTQWSTAEIIVNPNVDWGTNAAANLFDPIIVAMHELGHSIRLDHMSIVDGFSGRLNSTIGPNAAYPDGTVGMPDGPVMRPFTAPGNNSMNPLLNTIYDRYPYSFDISEAGQSSALAPSPSGAGLLVIAGGAMLRRRRAK